MAELSQSGTYVKFVAHAWMDDTTGQIKVNTADPAFRKYGGIHFTGKQGTKTRECISKVLDDFGCGPNTKHKPKDPLSEISKDVDQLIASLEKLDGLGVPVADGLEQAYAAREKIDEMLPEVK